MPETKNRPFGAVRKIGLDFYHNYALNALIPYLCLVYNKSGL